MNSNDELREDTQTGWPGALNLDVEKYRHYVDKLDISEEQKNKVATYSLGHDDDVCKARLGHELYSEIQPADKAVSGNRSKKCRRFSQIKNAVIREFRLEVAIGVQGGESHSITIRSRLRSLLAGRCVGG